MHGQLIAKNNSPKKYKYTEAVLKFLKLNPQAQQRETVVQGRSLSPYRLRYNEYCLSFVPTHRQCSTIELLHEKLLK
ncbi:MAG: hypothetical protein LBJ00_15250 [Planctomycetaceae bacterium]|nr:hypothetical protein [Planctomycetaceae bacterium]